MAQNVEAAFVRRVNQYVGEPPQRGDLNIAGWADDKIRQARLEYRDYALGLGKGIGWPRVFAELAAACKRLGMADCSNPSMRNLARTFAGQAARTMVNENRFVDLELSSALARLRDSNIGQELLTMFGAGRANKLASGAASALDRVTADDLSQAERLAKSVEAMVVTLTRGPRMPELPYGTLAFEFLELFLAEQVKALRAVSDLVESTDDVQQELKPPISFEDLRAAIGDLADAQDDLDDVLVTFDPEEPSSEEIKSQVSNDIHALRVILAFLPAATLRRAAMFECLDREVGAIGSVGSLTPAHAWVNDAAGNEARWREIASGTGTTRNDFCVLAATALAVDRCDSLDQVADKETVFQIPLWEALGVDSSSQSGLLPPDTGSPAWLPWQDFLRTYQTDIFSEWAEEGDPDEVRRLIDDLPWSERRRWEGLAHNFEDTWDLSAYAYVNRQPQRTDYDKIVNEVFGETGANAMRDFARDWAGRDQSRTFD